MKNSISKNIARVFGAFYAPKTQIALAASILGFCSIGIAPAKAAIINHTDVNGLRTFEDVGTGLVWVDLDNFVNQSTSDMKTIVEAAGFTFANKSSVQTLLGGIPDLPASWNSYASIMGRSSSRDLIWGSYDSGNNNIIGWAFSFSNDSAWSYNDNTGFSISSIPASDMNIFAYQSSSTAVPEPFTIVGTLVGGTAALRMKKKLKSTAT